MRCVCVPGSRRKRKQPILSELGKGEEQCVKRKYRLPFHAHAGYAMALGSALCSPYRNGQAIAVRCADRLLPTDTGLQRSLGICGAKSSLGRASHFRHGFQAVEEVELRIAARGGEYEITVFIRFRLPRSPALYEPRRNRNLAFLVYLRCPPPARLVGDTNNGCSEVNV